MWAKLSGENKFRIIFISTLATLATAFYIHYWWNNVREVEIIYLSEHLQNYESMDNVVYAAMSTLNDDDIVFVIREVEGDLPLSRRSYIPGHYVTRRQSDLRWYRSSVRGLFSVWERGETEIYNIITGELVDVIDVLELIGELKDVYPERFDGHIYSEWIVSVEGEVYLEWEIGPGDYMYMNFQTREVTFHDRKLGGLTWDEKGKELLLQMSILIGSWPTYGVQTFLSNNGIEKEEWNDFRVWVLPFPGTVAVELLASILPDESENLYSRFPGLKEFREQDGYRITIILTGYPTAEEILTMFMEDGREISFDGAILREDWSIDGQEHEIHGFEDFFRWIDSERWINRPGAGERMW